MIRPMWGSSSATRTCVLVTAPGIDGSDECGEKSAIAAQLVQQGADVGARPQEDEEDGVLGQDRDDRQPVCMLEDGGREGTSGGGAAELVGRVDYGRDMRRHVLGVQRPDRLSVDEEPIPSEHDGGLDSLALANHANE